MHFLTEAEFDKAFKKRLIETRKERDMSRAQMAYALGITEDAYKKYEIRPKSFFPIALLPQLVFATNKSYFYWIDGQSASVSRLRAVNKT